MKEAAIEAKQGGERGITARSVKKVTAVSTIIVISGHVDWDEPSSYGIV